MKSARVNTIKALIFAFLIVTVVFVSAFGIITPVRGEIIQPTSIMLTNLGPSDSYTIEHTGATPGGLGTGVFVFEPWPDWKNVDGALILTTTPGFEEWLSEATLWYKDVTPGDASTNWEAMDITWDFDPVTITVPPGTELGTTYNFEIIAVDSDGEIFGQLPVTIEVPDKIYINDFASFPAYPYNTEDYQQAGALAGCGPTTGAMILAYFEHTYNLAGLLDNPVVGVDEGLNTAWTLHGSQYLDTNPAGFGSAYDIKPGMEKYAADRGHNIKVMVHVSPTYDPATAPQWIKNYGPYGDGWMNDGDFWVEPSPGNWDINDDLFCDFVGDKLSAKIAIWLAIDTDFDGGGDHWVPLVGYDRDTDQYAFYDTFDTGIHWADITYCAGPAPHANAISFVRSVEYLPPVDTDDDGIPDADEIAGWDITRYNCDGSILDTYHVTSDLNLADTDGDGLSDFEEKEGWHVSYTISTGTVAYDVQSNPEVVDYDGDGKNDAEEKTAGTDPNRGDTDCDDAYDTNDGFEIDNGLNPLNFDTDSDGVSDGEEIDLWMAAGYSLNDAIEKTKDPESIPLIPELCPDEYRWNTSVSPSGYEWDPSPELFRSWNDVHFVNSGPGDAFNVVASISYAPANVNIVDGEVTVGDIPASSGAWSLDFYELELDMTNPQDPNEGIEWTVEYDDAAGVHHVVENVPEFCAVG